MDCVGALRRQETFHGSSVSVKKDFERDVSHSWCGLEEEYRVAESSWLLRFAHSRIKAPYYVLPSLKLLQNLLIPRASSFLPVRIPHHRIFFSPHPNSALLEWVAEYNLVTRTPLVCALPVIHDVDDVESQQLPLLSPCFAFLNTKRDNVHISNDKITPPLQP